MKLLNSSDETEAVEKDDAFPGFLSPAVITLLLTIGLVAHILAILGTRRANRIRVENSRHVVPSFLLNSLLRIDMIAVIFFLIRGFLYPIPFFVDSAIWCDFSVSTSIFFTWSSGFANVLMCAERTFSVMAPFLHRQYATLRKVKVILGSMQAFAVFVCLLPTIGFGLYKIEVAEGYKCVSPGDLDVTVINKYHLHFTIIFFCVGFSIMFSILGFNMFIIYFIFHMRNKVAHLNVAVAPNPNDPKASSTNNANRKSNSEMRFAIIMVFVSIAYTISWLPLYLERLLLALSLNLSPKAQSIGIWIHVFNYVIDPVIFVFLKRRNRTALKLVCAECYCCCQCEDYKRKIDEELRMISNYGQTGLTDNTIQQHGTQDGEAELN